LQMWQTNSKSALLTMMPPTSKRRGEKSIARHNVYQGLVGSIQEGQESCSEQG